MAVRLIFRLCSMAFETSTTQKMYFILRCVSYPKLSWRFRINFDYFSFQHMGVKVLIVNWELVITRLSRK